MDTEVLAGGVAVPTSIVLFSNFASFRVAPTNTNVTQTKQFGRDTDMKSSGGGTLPQSTFFYWYRARMVPKTYLTDLNDAANAVVYEEIQRLRNLGSWTFSFSQTDLIVQALDELPSGIGSAYMASTLNNLNMPSLVNGMPGDGKDVTVSGRPVGIEALQQFSITLGWPQSTGLTPTVDIFLSARLDGLLVRGISG